jgi:hypothetical protein
MALRADDERWQSGVLQTLRGAPWPSHVLRVKESKLPTAQDWLVMARCLRSSVLSTAAVCC